MSTPARRTLAWVAWLRVVGIYGVVLLHTVGSTASGPGSTTTVDGWVARALDLPFVWAVPVFVMLSGTLGLDPARFPGSGPYLRRRVARLVPPLIFWHVVYVTYMMLTRPTWAQGPRDVLLKVLQGKVAPHLYFLWVVLGLSLLTPVVVRWVGATARREWVVAALVAYAVPLLGTLPLGPEGARVGFTHVAWSWWLPFLWAYLAGWALREVLLPRGWVPAAAAAALGLTVLVTWQWRNDAAPTWLQDWFGVSYYGVTVAALSVLVLLLAQTTIREGGALAPLASAPVMRIVAPLGQAAMGIYALHFLLLMAGTDSGVLGGAVAPWPVLVGRFLVVAAGTTLIVLVLRRVPGVRALL